MERLEPLLPLSLAQLIRIGELEESRRELDEPLRIDSDDLAHILLRRQNELVINDPIGLPIEQRTRRMNVDRLIISQRLVALLRILARRVAKEAAANRHLNARRRSTARDDVQLVSIHDAEELLSHVLGASKGARLNEILVAPGVRELVVLPRIVNGEQREMIAFGLVKFRLALIGDRLLFLGTIEDVLNGEHGDDGENFFAAAQMNRLDENFRERRLERKLGHSTTESREKAFVVERTKRMELFESHHHGFHGRRIHEIEGEQIVDAHRFETEKRIG